MMSAGQNMMFYESPMMSPEHNSMPTMNTAEMFDNMWCSSDSGVSGDQSPVQPTSPSLDDDHCLWDPGDTSILEANFFNENRNLGFEDDLDLFSFANELGTEDEIEQLSFPDNISENSSSSSTITSYSIPSSPEHFSDDMIPSTCTERFIYPSTIKCEKIGTYTALCEDISKRQKGNYHKRSRKMTRDRQRKQASEKSVDNEDLEGCPDQKSDTLKGLNTLSPTRKNVSCILNSNIKWSELDSSDQWFLAAGFDTIISQSLGVREQLDVKAILKPHNTSSGTQDVHINNFTLLDDGKLEAVRRYLKSLEGCHSNTKPYLRQTSNMEKKPRKKNKMDNKFVKHHPNKLFKSNSVNFKDKFQNKEFGKSKSNDNQNKKSWGNFSENKLKVEKSINYKYISSSPKLKKETPNKNNTQQAIYSKSSNIDVNMTICQPSISWQQRQKPIKSKRSNIEVYKPKGTCAEDQRLQRTYAEQYQKQKISPTVCSSKSKEIHTGIPLKDHKKKTDFKSKTLTKKSRNSKQEQRSEFVLLRTRSRKEYRQLMKEKRSGLFLQEQVVSLSTTVANLNGVVHLNPNDQDTDDDVDILG